MATTNGCCATQCGPGYATPLDAFHNGTREKIIYVPCIVSDHSRPDYLATVDVDPESSTYAQVIHRLPMPFTGDELHHSGWNACSSCYDDPSKKRQFLILPAFKSGRVYAVDVGNEREPKLHKVVAGEVIAEVAGVSYPHSSHCLGSGDIMISTMGSPDGKAKGNFVLLDCELNVKGTWAEQDTAYGYDFWYQPAHNIMVSTEFGTPKEFFKGFNPAVAATEYGSKLHVWNWRERTLRQSIELGQDGLIPLEIRFLHDPQSTIGFVGCALSSNVIKLQVDPTSGALDTAVVVRQPWLDVSGWALPQLPPLITDILISLDDRWLFFSNWLRGDVCMYDLADPAAPCLASRLWLGGCIAAGGGVGVSGEALAGLGLSEQPVAPVVRGVKVQGGPQMLQLSLDGTRLYVTNSLLSPWDSQFYPDMVAKGGQLLQVDVDLQQGRLSLNPDFVIDFGAEPGGPVLAHECRYPGGDCSSDIWL
ncbi:selenium binding protein [Scenedesmus sp. NREL 46B-D3]|nr:selenium binding protein [Scenedesmus sp. NREL 46B-D3]